MEIVDATPTLSPPNIEPRCNQWQGKRRKKRMKTQFITCKQQRASAKRHHIKEITSKAYRLAKLCGGSIVVWYKDQYDKAYFLSSDDAYWEQYQRSLPGPPSLQLVQSKVTKRLHFDDGDAEFAPIFTTMSSTNPPEKQNRDKNGLHYINVAPDSDQDVERKDLSAIQNSEERTLDIIEESGNAVIVVKPETSADYESRGLSLNKKGSPKLNQISLDSIRSDDHTIKGTRSLLSKNCATIRDKPKAAKTAAEFISKVKERFKSKPQAYKSFLAILSWYNQGVGQGKESDNTSQESLVTDVQVSMAQLFGADKDLFRDFRNNFIPKEKSVESETSEKSESNEPEKCNSCTLDIVIPPGAQYKYLYVRDSKTLCDADTYLEVLAKPQAGVTCRKCVDRVNRFQNQRVAHYLDLTSSKKSHPPPQVSVEIAPPQVSVEIAPPQEQILLINRYCNVCDKLVVKTCGKQTPVLTLLPGTKQSSNICEEDKYRRAFAKPPAGYTCSRCVTLLNIWLAEHLPRKRKQNNEGDPGRVKVPRMSDQHLNRPALSRKTSSGETVDVLQQEIDVQIPDSLLFTLNDENEHLSNSEETESESETETATLPPLSEITSIGMLPIKSEIADQNEHLNGLELMHDSNVLPKVTVIAPIDESESEDTEGDDNEIHSIETGKYSDTLQTKTLSRSTKDPSVVYEVESSVPTITIENASLDDKDTLVEIITNSLMEQMNNANVEFEVEVEKNSLETEEETASDTVTKKKTCQSH